MVEFNLEGLVIVYAHVLEALKVDVFVVYSEFYDEVDEMTFDVLLDSRGQQPLAELTTLLLRVDAVHYLLLIRLEFIKLLLSLSQQSIFFRRFPYQFI